MGTGLSTKDTKSTKRKNALTSTSFFVPFVSFVDDSTIQRPRHGRHGTAGVEKCLKQHLRCHLVAPRFAFLVRESSRPERCFGLHTTEALIVVDAWNSCSPH